ncbi:MAG: hypothetical protein GY752_08945, partial [bacterium]|nr:hypothetical protein [bacterium]
MNFDPQKPFGRIFGKNKKFPSARFNQGGLLYDAHRKCLNPDDAKQSKDPTANDAIAEATDVLREKASKVADAALKKLEKAKAALESKGTPASKAAYTKALKAYDQA